METRDLDRIEIAIKMFPEPLLLKLDIVAQEAEQMAERWRDRTEIANLRIDWPGNGRRAEPRHQRQRQQLGIRDLCGQGPDGKADGT